MATSVSTQKLSHLIDGIYACATDPGAWSAALQRINEATKSHASVVGIVSFGEDFSLVNAVAGFDDGFASRYAANLPGLSAIWGGDRQIAARPMNEPVVLSLHHSDALIRGSPKHDLLCEVLGFEVEDTLNLPLAHLGRAIGAAGFARKDGQGAFERELYGLFRLLSPHIQRSADINRLLDAQALALTVRDRLLDRLRAPVIVVDARMRVIQSNELAEPYIQRVSQHRQTAEAVADVGRGKTRYRCVASKEAEGDNSLIIHVMSLFEDAEPHLSGFVAIVLAPTRFPKPQAIRALAEQHRLTDAESSVLQHLIRGKSSTEIAAALLVQSSTVRTHILRIFEKFDVHHRAELVALITAYASPFEPSIHQTVDASPCGST